MTKKRSRLIVALMLPILVPMLLVGWGLLRVQIKKKEPKKEA